MELRQRHLLWLLSAALFLTVTSFQHVVATEAEVPEGPATTPWKRSSRFEGLGPHLYRVLGDGNATRLVLPNEDTVIIDGTKGNMEGFKSGGGVWNSEDSTFLKKVARSSSDLFGNKTFFALLVVSSQPSAAERVRRETIRKSWGRWAPELDIKIIFFLGSKPSLTSENVSSILDEISQHHDIVIDNIEDDYYRTSVKALRMFKWFLWRFPDESTRPTFVAKCDPDSFINLRVVAKHLRNAPNKDSYIGGTFYPWRWVDRDPWTKHFIPYQYYAEPKYPQFLLGCLMMFSSKLVEPLLKASLTETLIPDDDVFITGIIGNKKLGLNLTGIEGYHTVEWRINVSNPWLDAVLFHLPNAGQKVFVEMYDHFNKARPKVE